MEYRANRNADVACKYHPGERPAADFKNCDPFSTREAERLDEALKPVAQMQAKSEQANDINTRNARVPERIDHHVVAIVFGVDLAALCERHYPGRHAHRELEQVIDHKAEHCEASQHHCPGCQRSLAARVDCILLRTRLAVLFRQQDGRQNVREKTGKQERADHVEQRPEAVQEGRVLVDIFRGEKDLKVAGQMPENVPDQNEAREGDDPLFPDGRFIEINNEAHAFVSISLANIAVFPSFGSWEIEVFFAREQTSFCPI